MFKLIKKKTNLEQTVIDSIVKNCLFEKAVIYRLNSSRALRGIKLIFKDGSSGIIWAYGDKSYVFNYQAFDSIFKINVPTESGDEIWGKFLATFKRDYTYEDV